MFQSQSGMTDGMIQIQIDRFPGPALFLTKLFLGIRIRSNNQAVNLIRFIMICCEIGVIIYKYTTVSIKHKIFITEKIMGYI